MSLTTSARTAPAFNKTVRKALDSAGFASVKTIAPDSWGKMWAIVDEMHKDPELCSAIDIIGTHDPGAGWRFREGIHPVVNDSLVISAYGANDQASGDDNYCLRIDDDETQAAAIAGDLALNSVIFACQENSKGNAIGGFANEQLFAEDQGNQFATIADGTAVDVSDAADPAVTLFTGALKVQSLPWDQLAVDNAAAIGTTQPTSGTATDILGGLGATDWTAGWTYGLNPDNRAQPLWFE